MVEYNTLVQLEDYHAATADPSAPFVDLPFELKAAGRLKISIDSYIQVEQEPRGYRHIPFVYTLFDPSGSPFLGDTITPGLLDKFRDNRGILGAKWMLRLHPAPAAVVASPRFVSVQPGSVQVAVEEPLVSESAPPAIAARRILRTGDAETLQLDLYRKGELRVRSWEDLGQTEKPTRGLWFTLFDPDGVARTTGRDSGVEFTINDHELGKCRDRQGRPRMWSLKVEKGPGFRANSVSVIKLEAQVFAAARVPQDVLGSRLQTLLKPGGRSSFRIGLKWDGTRRTTQFVLRVSHERTLETLDMHDVLDGLPAHLNPGVDVQHPKVGVDYVVSEMVTMGDLFLLSDITGSGYGIRPKNFAITGADVRLKRTSRRTKKVTRQNGAGQPIVQVVEVMPAGLPGLEVNVQSTGTIKVVVPGDDGELALRAVKLDIGFMARNGTVEAIAWLDPNSIAWAGEEGAVHGAAELADFWTSDALTLLREFSERLAAQVVSAILPKVTEVMLGGRCTISNATWETGAIVFEYVPPMEPERLPNRGYRNAGSAPLAPAAERLAAMAAERTLKEKFDHIVVLMMENRSFDHVLGYRSLLSRGADVDGLTDAVIQAFSKNARSPNSYEKEIFRWLGDPQFKHGGRDPVFVPHTMIPLHIGHGFADVAEQVAEGAMTGFVTNIRNVAKRGFEGSDTAKESAMRAHMRSKGVRPYDVLGYYTDDDLPLYGHLADQFAICDRFFCAHPGPTMPNRMYSLTGNLYVNRFSEPQVDNGTGGGVRLSRRTTIFDILSQQGVSWRVYESPPSVSMLRYFARYAGAEDPVIRDVKYFAEDARQGALPSVTFIDPAYHYAPPNDDHPPADMLRGQHFVKRIYDALRSNPSAWERTLLVLTYDEHGGLFDHVPPPVAETWSDPSAPQVGGGFGPSAADTAIGGRRRVPRPSRMGEVRLPGRPTRGPGPRYKPDVVVKYGVRVPTFLVSPYIEPGTVRHETWDFAAILKTILVRYCGKDHPFLADRVHASATFAPALSRDRVRTDIENSPSLPRPAPTGGVRGRGERFMRKADLVRADSDWHEFMAVLSRLTRG